MDDRKAGQLLRSDQLQEKVQFFRSLLALLNYDWLAKKRTVNNQTNVYHHSNYLLFYLILINIREQFIN